MAAFFFFFTSVSDLSAWTILNSGSALRLVEHDRGRRPSGLSMTGTVAKVMFLGSTLLSSLAESVSFLTLPMPVSTVSALVAALARSNSFDGLVSVSLGLHLADHRAEELLLEFDPVEVAAEADACRVRTNASACSPLTCACPP